MARALRIRRTDKEETRAYLLMVGPAFFLYLLVMAFPIVLSVALSFSNYNGGKMFGAGSRPWGFAGFDKFTLIFSDPNFWNALKNNMYIVAISVFGQLPLGFVLAYIIYRRIVRWPEFWQGILFVPNIISVIVIGILWQTIFSPYGPLSEFFNAIYQNEFRQSLAAIIGSADTSRISDDMVKSILGLAGPAGSAFFTDPVPELKALIMGYGANATPQVLTDITNLFAQKWTPDFLNKPDIAMVPILFVILWIWTGLYLIMFLANMQKIDTQIIESARIDGANEGQVMRYIVLPSLSGTLVNSAILAIAGSLNSFALVFAMTGGGPGTVTEILAIYMYRSAFSGAPNFPLANAIALVMVLVSFVLIVITKSLEKRFGGKED